jgi:hypothetical protein
MYSKKNRMNTTIPCELISKIIDYVSDTIGFDFKYNRYLKTWGFTFNKSNKKKIMLNNLITEKWCVRKFYDMSNNFNKKIESLPNYSSVFRAVYYTNNLNISSINIKISVFTNIDNNTIISVYSKKYSVENMIHKISISKNNVVTYHF